MIRSIAVAALFSSVLHAAPESADLLRFSNGDQLHGSFLGIGAGSQVRWKRDDLADAVEFKTGGLRHIVLNGGRPTQSLGGLSHVGLSNGDRIPGTVTALDEETLTLDTGCAGVLRVPRKHLPFLAPNPLGGRVHYHGPFTEDGWKMAHTAFPEGLPAPQPDEKSDAGSPGRWEFSGSAWYWKGPGAGTALLRADGMTERSVLRFTLAWKSRLNIAVAFHADLASPGTGDKEGGDKPVRKGVPAADSSDLPRLFGNSYVLQMYSSYLMLYRTTVDAEGGTNLERVQLNNNNLRLGETGRAAVEIRSNRSNGNISLFINDEFVSQWSEGGPNAREGVTFAGKGGGFGFVVQGDESPVRLSDIVVSEWNGMPDSARSLEVEDQDVVLMANGTDRFAGKILRMESDGRLSFEGRHGRFHFPLSDVAEIRFARSRVSPAPEDPVDSLTLRMDPIGSISGRPVAGDRTRLNLQNPVLGAVQVSTAAAVMIEFNPSNQIIDDWDADF